MLNQGYLDAFHENVTLCSLNNSRQEVGGVHITSKQLLWGSVIMQHRKCHSMEQWGTPFQGSPQSGSDFTPKDALFSPYSAEELLAEGTKRQDQEQDRGVKWGVEHSAGFGIREPRGKSQLCYLQVIWPCARDSTSLSLSFAVSKWEGQ